MNSIEIVLLIFVILEGICIGFLFVGLYVFNSIIKDLAHIFNEYITWKKDDGK